jgi:hypothetical protein
VFGGPPGTQTALDVRSPSAGSPLEPAVGGATGRTRKHPESRGVAMNEVPTQRLTPNRVPFPRARQDDLLLSLGREPHGSATNSQVRQHAARRGAIVHRLSPTSRIGAAGEAIGRVGASRRRPSTPARRLRPVAALLRDGWSPGSTPTPPTTAATTAAATSSTRPTPTSGRSPRWRRGGEYGGLQSTRTIAAAVVQARNARERKISISATLLQ